MMNLKSLLREFPDFPRKGLSFIDISPILKEPRAMQFVADQFYDIYKNMDINLLAGIEARGFIFACRLAIKLGKGFIMVRRQGKLPGATINLDYDTLYGNFKMEIQEDSVTEGENVLIVDDLIATGRTARAAGELVERLGGNVTGFAFVVEVTNLKGRDLISGYDVHSLTTYP